METHTLTGSGCYLPAVDPMEMRILAAKYGEPVRRWATIETDDYLATQRWRPIPDRRGEVIFIIRQPNGEILLHSKQRYEQPIYRLPTGGIEPSEAVEDALLREVEEETGQSVIIRRFLAILNCDFRRNGSSIPFTSYLFYLESRTRLILPDEDDEPAEFQTMPVQGLPHVAANLRALNGRRKGWGYWRSLAHDLVHDLLGQNSQFN
ncbi:MAG TPA: NUDIX hydrolase [Caldilineaceae bacterium]|nr:NUDIX hydrolase [Caldilineaceae bacterium]